MNKIVLVSLIFLFFWVHCSADIEPGIVSGYPDEGLISSYYPVPGVFSSYGIDNQIFDHQNESCRESYSPVRKNLSDDPGFHETRKNSVSYPSVSSISDIPCITSYTPESGLNNNEMQQVIIHGLNFKHGLSANFTNGTYRQKNLTSVVYTSSSAVTVPFNLQGMSPGRYWVDIRNPWD